MILPPARADAKVMLKRPAVLLAIAILFAISLIGANIAGRQAARADIERLEKVWPFLDRLSEADRAFLAGLAMTCKLHHHGETQSEVVTCLRTAADLTSPLAVAFPAPDPKPPACAWRCQVVG